ncbi:unnamed protein product [Prunus armeniaca]
MTDRLYLKIVIVILVWMSSMQYTPPRLLALPVPHSTRYSESSEDLVSLSRGKKAIGCRWAFTLKHKADGSIDRYKPRFVVKGYTQTYGVDYLETFAPVAKLNTVCVLLSLATNRNWPFLQFDVKNAFLHGDLKEEIYMDLPPGIHMTFKEGVVFSVVSQFMHSPSKDHMGVVMRILRNLKVGSVTDRRSTFGYFTFVSGNLVTWMSKKQKVVSQSSAEVEYRGMAQGVCKLLWLRRLLRDLRFAPQKPMDLYCDNKAAIVIAYNPVQHDRTKHVEVDRHFIKENVDAEIVSFPFISSEYQLVDVLTKAVSTTVFLNLLDKLGMHSNLIGSVSEILA